MKRLATGFVMALLLGLAPQTSAGAENEASAASAMADAREPRKLKRLTNRFEAEPYWHFDDKGRVMGEDGKGIFVYIQVRKCGTGKWHNLIRETTTESRAFDFSGYYKPAVKKKYKVKEYIFPKFPNGTQYGFFIPATDEYRAYRVADTYCYG